MVEIRELESPMIWAPITALAMFVVAMVVIVLEAEYHNRRR